MYFIYKTCGVGFTCKYFICCTPERNGKSTWSKPFAFGTTLMISLFRSYYSHELVHPFMLSILNAEIQHPVTCW